MLSCTRNPGLARTFQRGGENRAELEKVLRHYEGDGRKHRAALFLLERMADEPLEAWREAYYWKYAATMNRLPSVK